MRPNSNTPSEPAVVEAGKAPAPAFEPTILASWPKTQVFDIRRGRRTGRSRPVPPTPRSGGDAAA